MNEAPQQAYIPKEEAALPMVSTKLTFITASIAASEKRKVRCYNIPSAFVNTDMDEDVLMVLKGELTEMMIQIAPQVYRKYVMVDRKGTKILYVKLQKALYGLMRSSLLFYRKLRKEFEKYRLIVNPYDPCIANKTTEDGNQLMVVWHVDNLMALCVEDFELTKFSCYLAKIYKPKLSMHTGRKHDYLGVDMEFNKDSTLVVSMFKYLDNVIRDFPEVISGQATTPAADYLFNIRDKPKQGCWKKKEH
jgi:hypothetical protein